MQYTANLIIQNDDYNGGLKFTVRLECWESVST